MEEKTNEHKYLDTPMNEGDDLIKIEDNRTPREFLASLIEDAEQGNDPNGVRCLKTLINFFEQNQ